MTANEVNLGDFPQSLLSIGKLANDNTVSIFTDNSVTVHNKTDVLGTCKGKTHPYWHPG